MWGIFISASPPLEASKNHYLKTATLTHDDKLCSPTAAVTCRRCRAQLACFVSRHALELKSEFRRQSAIQNTL